MKRILSLPALLVAAALSILAPPAAAQRPQTREGFWFNIGLGYGSFGCDGCDGRTGSASGGLSAGGTLSKSVLLGVGAEGWSKSEGGTTLSVGTIDARVRIYPNTTTGFFLTGGLGLGVVSAGIAGVGNGSEVGVGLVVGIGVDVRVGRNVSLTPFWNGFGVKTSSTTTNVGEIGVGLTVH